MRTLFLVASLAIGAGAVSSEPGSADAFEQIKTLVGEWQAELPGFGTLTNSIRLVSGGKGVEETIGTPAENETSIYMRRKASHLSSVMQSIFTALPHPPICDAFS